MKVSFAINSVHSCLLNDREMAPPNRWKGWPAPGNEVIFWCGSISTQQQCLRKWLDAVVRWLAYYEQRNKIIFLSVLAGNTGITMNTNTKHGLVFQFQKKKYSNSDQPSNQKVEFTSGAGDMSKIQWRTKHWLEICTKNHKIKQLITRHRWMPWCYKWGGREWMNWNGNNLLQIRTSIHCLKLSYLFFDLTKKI